MIAAGLMLLGVLSRILIHVPNFTPLIAISLFSGAYIKRRYAVLLPLAILGVSDLIIGLHETMFFTWGSVLLISLMGLKLRGQRNFKNVFGMGLLSSILFFVVTNLGVWLVGGLYPLTMSGLYECFVLAIPFFRYELLATLVYSAVLFGAYEYLKNRIGQTKFAHVL